MEIQNVSSDKKISEVCEKTTWIAGTDDRKFTRVLSLDRACHSGYNPHSNYPMNVQEFTSKIRSKADVVIVQKIRQYLSNVLQTGFCDGR